METRTPTEELLELIARASGDEKHDASSYSTLDVIQVLYEVLRVDPARPEWEERDRFLLSKGHGPLAFYAVLAHNGFFPPDELSRFMTWDGILGAHPDRLQVPGVEASTGSLGHGLPMAVGVAYALRARGLDEQRVFVLTGDAELNEGSNWEAILHAGSARLANLTLIVVDNRSSNVRLGEIAAKLRAFAWDAVTVDGRDHRELRAAYRHRSEAPTAIVAVV
ncbi:MAG: transketolase [Gaiellaceae bacterium]|jgi:transketolase|nr:transketolase [Gaiellaceae bacterium]